MLIDTHCHLNFEEFSADLKTVIANAHKAGIGYMVVPGVDTYSSTQAISLAQAHQNRIFPSIGAHPYEAVHPEELNGITKLLKTYRPIAIGECGLDYHMYKGEQALGKKDAQKFLFREQLHMALEYNLPVIMHCRDAFDDFFTILDNLPTIPKGVIHCFSGGLQDLRAAQERNLYVGIDGNCTYNKHIQTILSHIPRTMLVLETDAPYLTPVPFRGERNEPKHVTHIVAFIASQLQISTEELAAQTTHNAISLFTLPSPLSDDEQHSIQ